MYHANPISIPTVIILDTSVSDTVYNFIGNGEPTTSPHLRPPEPYYPRRRDPKHNRNTRNNAPANAVPKIPKERRDKQGKHKG